MRRVEFSAIPHLQKVIKLRPGEAAHEREWVHTPPRTCEIHEVKNTSNERARRPMLIDKAHTNPTGRQGSIALATRPRMRAT